MTREAFSETPLSELVCSEPQDLSVCHLCQQSQPDPGPLSQPPKPKMLAVSSPTSVTQSGDRGDSHGAGVLPDIGWQMRCGTADWFTDGEVVEEEVEEEEEEVEEEGPGRGRATTEAYAAVDVNVKTSRCFVREEGQWRWLSVLKRIGGIRVSHLSAPHPVLTEPAEVGRAYRAFSHRGPGVKAPGAPTGAGQVCGADLPGSLESYGFQMGSSQPSSHRLMEVHGNAGGSSFRSKRRSDGPLVAQVQVMKVHRNCLLALQPWPNAGFLPKSLSPFHVKWVIKLLL
ncbi:unnamed protein product [Gadus morhua 'NCC']